ncbi:oxygenase MpaB family protein [Agromyces seonyuensis]|uniref:oxygenase MpaB family protein n=1 Tax=Agromyces seonyuensis TaxID=2662446 RepID=UPI001F24EC14|nr:oxygenase MpaB family protein [Agromyces seonyuensis]
MTLGAVFGLGGAIVPGAAQAATREWTWSAANSVVPTALGGGSTVDPAWVWDEPIDTIIAQAIQRGETAQINAALLPWVHHYDPVPSAGLPADLAAWLQESVQMPAWADMTKLRRAADFNRRKDTYLFMLYGVGGGIMSTVIPREAKSVYWSKGGADMQDRAAKTFSFGYDLSDIDAFENTGEFRVTSNKTRMTHAAVRHLLPQSPHWLAVRDESIPISNQDILVTFHSTGTFAYQKLKEWRIPMSTRDEEAFLHSWQVALHFLGVRDEYIPATWKAATQQASEILYPRLTWTQEGQYLAEVLLGLVAQVDRGLTRGFLNEFVRYLLGNEIGDWLGLPRDYVSAATIRVGWPAFILFREGLNPIMPANFYLFDQLVRAIAMAFLNRATSPTTTPIVIPDMNRPDPGYNG